MRLGSQCSSSLRIFDELGNIWWGSAEDVSSTAGDAPAGAGWTARAGASSLHLEFQFNDSDSHEVWLDFSGALADGLDETVEIYNPATGQVLGSRRPSDLAAGQTQLGLRLHGHVGVRIIRADGRPATVGGVRVGASIAKTS